MTWNPLLTKIFCYCCQYLRALFHLGKIGPLYYRVCSYAARAKDDGRYTGSREQSGIHPTCAAYLCYFAPQQSPCLLYDGLYDGFLQRDLKWLPRQAGFDGSLKGRVVRGDAREDGGEFCFDMLQCFARDGAPFYAQGAAFGVTRKLLSAIDERSMNGTGAEQAMGGYRAQGE